MNNMLERESLLGESFDQKGRTHVNHFKIGPLKPGERKVEMAFATGKRPIGLDQFRIRLPSHEVQADLVVIYAGMAKEILNEKRQSFTDNRFFQFFLHFAHCCIFSSFAWLDPSAGQGPKVIAFNPVQ